MDGDAADAISSPHRQNARRIYACRTRTVVVFLTPQQAGAAGLTAAVSESSPAKLLPEGSPANLRWTKRRKWSILWVGRIRPPLRDFRPHNTPPGPPAWRAGKQEAFPSPMTI